ncbi:MAG TPA: cupin domain-containing protein [Solirubrobacterales bacterium]
MPTPVAIRDVPLESQDSAAGWSISEFRLPVRGDGFAVFHGRFRPGSRHSAHRHLRSDELCVYMSGRGLVGTGEDRYAVGPGDARLMPAGVPHYFHNAGTDGVAEVLGLYVGAESVEDTGYELVGSIGEEDLRRSEEGGEATRYPWRRAGTAPPADAPGWHGAEVRELVGDGRASCFSADVEPGGGFEGEHAAAVVMYVDGGECLVDGAPAGQGCIWQAAPGERLSLRNSSGSERLALYGFAVVADESHQKGELN